LLKVFLDDNKTAARLSQHQGIGYCFKVILRKTSFIAMDISDKEIGILYSVDSRFPKVISSGGPGYDFSHICTG
jgi:hypothetical protein